MPPGLAIARDREPLEVGNPVFLQRLDRRLEQGDRFRIRHVIARRTGIELALVAMLEEKIGRDHRKAVARAALRLVAGVLHQAIALMHQDDGREPSAVRRIGHEGRHTVFAGDVFARHIDSASYACHGCPPVLSVPAPRGPI
jgi:hypothetical protein